MYEYDDQQVIPPTGFAYDPYDPYGSYDSRAFHGSYDAREFPGPSAPSAPYEPGRTVHLASVPPQAQDSTQQWDLDAEFEQLFRPVDAEPPAPLPEQPPVRPRAAAPRADRRRRRPRLVRLRWSTVLGIGIAAVTSSVVVTVSVLGAMVSYGPLRQLASPTARSLAGSWPLVVYGPWFVGCLSILHAAAHKRRARTAWAAVVVFSGIAMSLCISHAPRTPTAVAAAGLPPLSALVSFHLLLRQITLLHPRHAKFPRQRKH